jgi:peroxiredoxin
MLTVGDLAPEFSGQDQHGKQVSLSPLLERGRLVLYFYPKDLISPPCAPRKPAPFATLRVRSPS